MPYYAYILRSGRSGKHYIGSCQDLSRRLKEHKSGKTRSTRGDITWMLVHSEKFEKREEAYKREREIKRYKGGNAFKNLLGLI